MCRRRKLKWQKEAVASTALLTGSQQPFKLSALPISVSANPPPALRNKLPSPISAPWSRVARGVRDMGGVADRKWHLKAT